MKVLIFSKEHSGIIHDGYNYTAADRTSAAV